MSACLRHQNRVVEVEELLDQPRQLERLIALANVEVTVETDPERLRPSDVEILIGDASKFKADTGWEPRIPFDQTLRDLLDYWRTTLRRRHAA